MKTTSRTSSQGHVSFNPNTLQFVDRVIILRFNAEEMELEILLDKTVEEAKTLMTANSNGKLSISMSIYINGIKMCVMIVRLQLLRTKCMKIA